MKAATGRHARTRRAILDALAQVIDESGAINFSIQQVADRAGVTHRTVYNHFPTRQDLNDGFADYVEELARELGHVEDTNVSVAKLPELARHNVHQFEQLDTHLRAYVMLMIASRAPARVTRDRSDRFKRALVEQTNMPARDAQRVVAAVRLILSATGWHLLTEHHGLSNAETTQVVEWATRVLLDAATRGDLPNGKG